MNKLAQKKKLFLFTVAIFSFLIGLVLNFKNTQTFTFLDTERANADATTDTTISDYNGGCGSGGCGGGSSSSGGCSGGSSSSGGA